MVSLGRGLELGSGIRWAVGGWFPLENEEGECGWGEWGAGVWTGKGTGKRMHTRLSKLPFSKLLGWHLCSTKLPPKKQNLIRYEKGFEKREKEKKKSVR